MQRYHMLEKVKGKIESKRQSKNIFWQVVVFLKDVAWRIDRLLALIVMFAASGWKIKYIRKNSFRYRVGKMFPKNCMLLDCSDKSALFIPLSNKKDYGRIVFGEYYALAGYFRRYMPKKGDVVIDAGAYFGLCTIVLSLLVGKSGKVLSFEPDAKSFKKLQNNVEYNNLENTILFNKGLSDRTGEHNLYSYAMSSSYIIKDPKAELQRAEIIRLDEQLMQLGIKKIDFIKMDVEGAEVKALKGSEKTLRNNNVNIAVASYHEVDGRQTRIALEKILREYGYEAETGNEEHLTTYGWQNQAV